MIDRALSVRAPWWWAILHLDKDIENRPRAFHFTGRVWLHASAWWTFADVQDDWEHIQDIYRELGGSRDDTGITWRDMRESGGAIVGSVELCGTVTASDSPWFFGPYGIKLANPVALPKPVPCKGALGLFRPSAEVMERLADA